MPTIEALPSSLVIAIVALANILFGEIYMRVLRKNERESSDASVAFFSLGSFVLLFLMAVISIFFLSRAYQAPAQSTKDFRLLVIFASFAGFFWGAIRKIFSKLF